MPFKDIFQSMKCVKTQNKIPRDIPGCYQKIPGSSGNKNPGIFYLGIFQKSKSRDFWSRDFLIPGLSRDIPEPGYPAHTISAIFVFFTNNPWIYGLRIS